MSFSIRHKFSLKVKDKITFYYPQTNRDIKGTVTKIYADENKQPTGKIEVKTNDENYGVLWDVPIVFLTSVNGKKVHLM